MPHSAYEYPILFIVLRFFLVQEPAPKAPAEKAPKKPAPKAPAEKKGKTIEPEKEEPLDPLAEKLRQQR